MRRVDDFSAYREKTDATAAGAQHAEMPLLALLLEQTDAIGFDRAPDALGFFLRGIGERMIAEIGGENDQRFVAGQKQQDGLVDQAAELVEDREIKIVGVGDTRQAPAEGVEVFRAPLAAPRFDRAIAAARGEVGAEQRHGHEQDDVDDFLRLRPGAEQRGVKEIARRRDAEDDGQQGGSEPPEHGAGEHGADEQDRDMRDGNDALKKRRGDDRQRHEGGRAGIRQRARPPPRDHGGLWFVRRGRGWHGLKTIARGGKFGTPAGGCPASVPSGQRITILR